jgi:hypothetical protein
MQDCATGRVEAIHIADVQVADFEEWGARSGDGVANSYFDVLDIYVG